MKLTKNFMAAMAFATTVAFAQGTQPDVAPGVDPETYADAVNIHDRLAAMSEKGNYPSPEAYRKRVESDKCAAVHIASLNESFRALLTDIKKRNDIPESDKNWYATKIKGMVTSQAAFIMIDCDRRQNPSNIFE